MTAPQPADDEGLWIRSDVMPDGTYAVTITFEADLSWVLDRDGAQRYATVAVAAAQRAEYDAAIFALLTKRLSFDVDMAAKVIGFDIRPDRPPLDDEATAPLTFVPSVTAAGKAFLLIHVDGKPRGQVSPAALREHAMVVLEAPAAADLDAGFLKALLGFGLVEETARQVVMDIANWRTP